MVLRTRRHLLGVAAAAAAAACGHIRRQEGQRAQLRQSPSPPTVPVALYWTVPLAESVEAALAQGVVHAVPGMTLHSGPVSRSLGISWWLNVAFDVIDFPVDLSQGLREVNFDPGVLVSGATMCRGFVEGQRQVAMPVGLMPMAVDYNPLAFAAADLPLPARTWTLADFEDSCASLQTAIAAGKLEAAGISQVLYTLRSGASVGGFDSDPDTGTTWSQLSVSLGQPDLWEAFVQGFGGTVAASDGVHWDEGVAFTGIQRLMEIFSRFGSGPVPAATQAAMAAAWQASAMRLVRIVQFLTPPPTGAAAVPRLAAFPRMDVRPVVPVNALAGYLLYGAAGPIGSGPPPAGAATGESEAVLAAARYLQWQYEDAQQRLLAAGGVAPVTRRGVRLPGYWTQFRIGDPMSDLVFPYPWPRGPNSAAAVLHSGLAKLAVQTLSDPEGLQARLHTLGAQVTAAMPTHVG